MAFKGMNSPGALGEYTHLEIEHILPNKPERSCGSRSVLPIQGKATTSTK
jgi:hypothetical protein